ncbi:MAG TPA: hypothetical protein VK918_04610 [Pyrinomonadaceae bacterium]|nr:hypothetical protein [Pyrinomonadaceae bacterium]
MVQKAKYDTSIGTEERSVRSATKLWAIVFGFIFLIGITLILVFYWSSSADSGPGGTGRPADPGNVGP